MSYETDIVGELCLRPDILKNEDEVKTFIMDLGVTFGQDAKAELIEGKLKVDLVDADWEKFLEMIHLNLDDTKISVIRKMYGALMGEFEIVLMKGETIMEYGVDQIVDILIKDAESKM